MYKSKQHQNITIILLAIFSILLSFTTKICDAKEANYPDIIKSDYVLIINSYTESSDWSNKFIHSITESVFKDKSQLTVYVEHMNMLMVTTEEELADFKNKLLSSYESKTPKMIVLLGNTPWSLLQDTFEEKWPNVPIMLCAEKDFIGPTDAYLHKYPIEVEQRVPLNKYDGPLDLTLLHIPSFANETINLMQTLIPSMNKILFLCDNRYISKENRLEVENIIKEKYSNLTSRPLKRI